MPDASVWSWTRDDTAAVLAVVAGDLVSVLGLVAVFLVGFAVLARIGR